MAGVLLVALGVSMVVASPAFGIAIFSLPAVAIGAWAAALRSLARPLAIFAATFYGLMVAFVATTPLRGLTPAPGQTREPLDPAMVALAAGFCVVAVLALIGKSPADANDAVLETPRSET